MIPKRANIVTFCPKDPKALERPKSAIYTPKPYNEHPYHFYMGRKIRVIIWRKIIAVIDTTFAVAKKSPLALKKFPYKLEFF